MTDIVDPTTNLRHVRTGAGDLLRVVPSDETGAYVASGATPSTTLYSGHQATSTSAAQLNSGTSQACSAVIVQNDTANTAGQGIRVGVAADQSFYLDVGQAITLAVSDVNKVYAKSVSGTPQVNWLARN